MGPEATLWGWMRRGLTRVGLPHDVHRIETSTEKGYPDVEGCIGGTCFITELKVAYRIRRDGTFQLDHYVQEQAYTLDRRHRAGGRSFLLLRVDVSRHYLVPGWHAAEMFDARKALTERMVADWALPVDPSAKAEQLWLAMIRPMAA